MNGLKRAVANRESATSEFSAARLSFVANGVLEYMGEAEVSYDVISVGGIRMTGANQGADGLCKKCQELSNHKIKHSTFVNC